MSKMFVTAPELIVHRLIIFILKVKALKIFFRIHLIFLCYREEYFTHLQEISINRDADVENGLVDTGWGRREWGELGEGIDIYTLPCVKQIASGKLLYNTRRSACCSVLT